MYSVNCYLQDIYDNRTRHGTLLGVNSCPRTESRLPHHHVSQALYPRDGVAGEELRLRASLQRLQGFEELDRLA